MGLDLFHVLVCAKTDSTTDYLYVEEDDEANKNFFGKHPHIFEEEEEVLRDFSVLVFPDNKTKEMVLGAYKYYENRLFLVGDINSLFEEINKLALTKNLVDSSPVHHKTLDNILSEKAGRKIIYDEVKYKTGIKKHKIIYYTKIGYQRKGMSQKFYHDFQNGLYYFDKASVVKAMDYIESPFAEELTRNFQKNFIDKFIDGKSVFYCSW